MVTERQAWPEWFDERGDPVFLARFTERLVEGLAPSPATTVSITDLQAQARRAAACLRRVERLLTPEQRAAVTECLLELAVLYTLQALFVLQESRSLETPPDSAHTG
ncbi:hypothetical protein [Caldilinea sp.]|uniref:hypothetical protein n=1 Tax=Caldilinea sp. TaxID=2293560 RepID=UPI0021DD4C07|nr:hypothetical protein [Caldilinea sp.]GIV70781.1 MAG: hypothetical protein KatS3mg048_3643 [Caldilinea sp.]